MSGGAQGFVGEDAIGINPTEFLTTWNFNNLPTDERSKYYKETRLGDGTLLREYWIYAIDREIEVAPGIFYPAWTYNGQVPGPTIRATEGDTVRIHFINGGTKSHSIHTHGFHTNAMDGVMSQEQGLLLPDESYVYEFKAEPFGTHVYHCHGIPVTEHIARGLHGAYIVDPLKDTRPKPDKEFVMVMNGFDVNFDGENEIYAVNSIAFEYVRNPIKVKQGELVRIYLSNMLEFDAINSFHVHANFFEEYPTGTKLEPDFFTDITVMGQGERSILDMRFKYQGKYMFHAHKTEFAELGWTGFFEVEE
ncbi:multicopper oxidase domain-containing protein [Candidatus Pacearchaeota archaeon]|nr:multicopper oxidase domain-containing protein [Candidatus Pacearchaeota archaeon]